MRRGALLGSDTRHSGLASDGAKHQSGRGILALSSALAPENRSNRSEFQVRSASTRGLPADVERRRRTVSVGHRGLKAPLRTPETTRSDVGDRSSRATTTRSQLRHEQPHHAARVPSLHRPKHGAIHGGRRTPVNTANRTGHIVLTATAHCRRSVGHAI